MTATPSAWLQATARNNRLDRKPLALRRARVAATAVTVLLLAAAGMLRAQTVSLSITRPSPGQFGFAELWNVTLYNPSTDTQTVYLHVEGSATNEAPLFVANSQEFHVAPGNLALTAKDIKPSDVWCEKGFEAFARPGPALPEGNYIYEITLVPEMSQTTLNLQIVAPKPLDLVWPPNGAKVTDSLPVFVWTRPVVPRHAGEFAYSVRVAEIQPRQSCMQATADPATTIEPNVSSATAWRYPESARKLIPGRTYAWRVEASDTGKTPTGTDDPMTKAGSFVYEPAAEQAESHDTIEYPLPGQSLLGHTSVVVRSEGPAMEQCVLEYSLGSDSSPDSWQMVGLLAKAQDRFVATWASDSALTRAQRPFGTPCVLRATVLGRQGRTRELSVKTVINQPPAPSRRGCGCGQKK